jgi:hypothetical protein
MFSGNKRDRYPRIVGLIDDLLLFEGGGQRLRFLDELMISTASDGY